MPDEKQQQSVENFFEEYCWIDKDHLEIKKDNFKPLRKIVNSYAKSIFEEREVFITAVNCFMETFHEYRYERFCRIDKIYESNEFKVKLLKFLQGKGNGGKRLRSISMYQPIASTGVSGIFNQMIIIYWVIE